MAGIKSSPTCLGAIVIISFLVIFFGVWAGEEAFHKNNKHGKPLLGSAASTDETISECDQGLPEYLRSNHRSLVSRFLAHVGLSRRLCANEDTPLRNKPFVVAHDSATGYCNTEMCTKEWVKTQTVGFYDQLQCGARALDLRVGFKDSGGPLMFHHGLYMDTGRTGRDLNVPNEIPEVLRWAKENPNELVLLLVGYCKTGFPSKLQGKAFDGDDANCDQSFFEPFEKLNINVIGAKGKPYGPDKAEKLADITVAKAKEHAKHADRPGQVLVIFATKENISPNFDENIGWPLIEKAAAWDKLWNYCALKLQDASKGQYNQLWMLQTIWQFHDSSLYPAGETKSSLINKAVRERMIPPSHTYNQWGKDHPDSNWKKTNFLLLNAVECEGPTISAYFGAKQATCNSKC